MKAAVFFGLSWIVLNTTQAQIKIGEARFVELYNDGQYHTLFNEALALRQEEYGKTALVDYFIGKSLCGMGQVEAGRRCLRNVLRLYPLSLHQRNFFETEALNCQIQVDNAALVRSLYLAFNDNGGSNLPYARSAGKLGYVLDCKDSNAFSFDPASDSVNYEDRLFPVEATDDAERYYRSFLGSNYNVSHSGRFIFVTSREKTLSSKAIADAAQSLERAYQFYSLYFNIRPPDKLITVYLMENKNRLADVAKITHGLILPKSNIGYSVLNDLSVLGNSDENNMGTIYHELFHIMIRTDVGDIPGWLDEGIASLYATSHWRGHILTGDINQWRTRVIKESVKVKQSMPSLKALINSNWHAFSPENSACDIAVNYAMAHHLALYLQQHDVLQRVVKAFKDRPGIPLTAGDSTLSDAKVLAEALGYDLSSLEEKFYAWMEATYGITGGGRLSSGYVDEADSKMAQEIFHDAFLAGKAYDLLENMVMENPELANDVSYKKLIQTYGELRNKHPALFDPVSQSAVYLSPYDRGFARALSRFVKDAQSFVNSRGGF